MIIENHLMLFAVDWIEIVIFLFIVGSSLIGQAFKVMQERAGKAEKKKAKRAAPRPAQAPQAGMGKPAAGQKQTALESEIEEFLRRSRGQAEGRKPGDRREGRPRPGAEPTRNPSPVRAEVVRSQKPPRRPPRPAVVKPTRPQPALPELASEEIEIKPQISLRERLENADRKRVAKEAERERLASGIGMADERMESHLREHFDGLEGLGASPEKLRHIAEGTDANVWATQNTDNAMAQRLVDMLTDPHDVKAALLAGEILRSPFESERW